MTLAHQALGINYKVISIDEEPADVRAGLNSLGIFPGVDLKITNKFWGSIMKVRIGNSFSISIREREAKSIQVEKNE